MMRSLPIIASAMLACLAGTLDAAQRQPSKAPKKPPEAEPSATPVVIPANVEVFRVETRSPLNKQVPFYLRVPAHYSQTRLNRVLLLCPIYNGDGLRRVSGDGPFLRLADERGWFVVAPTFKQEGKDTHDRTKSYYYPEEFSGKAVMEALTLIAQKHPISKEGLLLQGLSGGAQFVHRLAIWAPERVAAVAVNSSSWFDEPNEQSRKVAWLVTIGDSDLSYENTLKFVENLRGAGALPILRSYAGMVHEGSSKVDELDALFLKFYDEATQDKLETRRSSSEPPILAGQMPFVGDTQDWRCYPNKPESAQRVAEESRVYLPSDEIAKFWSGKKADEDVGTPTGLNGGAY
ncbi:MAG: hypothetical protein WCP06_10380 [Verrucomicrobiota bacterium]